MFSSLCSTYFFFKCTLKCGLQFVSIWISLKFCGLNGLTGYQTSCGFHQPGKESSRKHCRKIQSEKMLLTHSLIHHFETIQNTRKLQTTTEMWLLKDFKIHIAKKTLWKKVKLLILSNFSIFHTVFLMLFSSMS